MKNCLILGSGRSGTSMVAATLAKAGYFMGDRLSTERFSNPMGNFEDIEINRLNEILLAQVVPKRPRFIGNYFFRHRPIMWQRWLSSVPLNTDIPASELVTKQITALTAREPYCFKDPRFSYTLPVWRPFLKDTVFVCVFREPATTAESILKLSQKAPYLQNFSINWERAIQVWTLMYKHILEIHRYQGEWLFLHYNQAVTPPGLTRLAEFIEAAVDYSVPDPSLCQSFSNATVSEQAQKIYHQLCQLAAYQEPVFA
ncbi:MAG: sulfotransferase [Oscillatoria sp. PMC 1051.18]|nr:sulfotransferase [Oscillatoria sp. PMC 1050.18]MEC5032995.1 sulfotransferase [Oscillatoria sp. PMC 1051.18]